MAISLGYGILFATLITLVLVPSLYLIVEDIKRTFHA
jgi:multidrug efflux pump subunit AcrB